MFLTLTHNNFFEFMDDNHPQYTFMYFIEGYYQQAGENSQDFINLLIQCIWLKYLIEDVSAVNTTYLVTL